MDLTPFFLKFWIPTSVSYIIEAFQTSSDNCFSLFIDSVKTAGGRVPYVAFVWNRKCYFTELLVNSPGCPGVSTLLKGRCCLVLSGETWVRDVEGMVEVFPSVSSSIVAWNGNHFPLPGLINLAFSPVLFPL